MKWFILIFLSSPFLYPLSLSQRIDLRLRVEVFYAHLRQAPPPSKEAVARRVIKDLAVDKLIREVYHLSIDRESLHREWERVCQHTHRPDLLKALLKTLDNQPFLFEEVVLRPLLARSWFVQKMKPSGRFSPSPWWALTDEGNWGLTPFAPPEVNQSLQKKSWDEVVLTYLKNHPIPKDYPEEKSFHERDITLPDLGGCVPDTWKMITLENAPDPREQHTLVWTGAEVILFGGYNGNYLNDGYRYDPILDAWEPISEEGAPSPRSFHRACWTGEEMLVFGGRGYVEETEGAFKATGALYNPATDTWRPITTEGAPLGRSAPFAVWTGSEFLVWGGWDGTLSYGDGYRYDPQGDTWTKMAEENAPLGRNGRGVVWTGHQMILWGGWDGATYYNDGGIYDPETDTWTYISSEGAPTPRSSPGAGWTGESYITWGGWDGDFQATGGIYDPSSDTWTLLEGEGEPLPRNAHVALWTGQGYFIWGGNNREGYLADGALLDPFTLTWKTLATEDAPQGRSAAEGVMMDRGIFIFGGKPAYQEGAIYFPHCFLKPTKGVQLTP